MNEIFLDTETTGLSFKSGHRIVEIACVETKDLVPTNKIFHKIINPERDMPEEAFNVHGFSEEFLKNKETFCQVADEFINFIKGKRLVIHNSEFDLSHLNNELKILGKGIIKEEVIDTLKVARSKFPGSSISLDALCKRYNIDNSRREKHNAVIDCELLSKVYINLLDQKEPSFNLSLEQNNENKILSKSKNIYYKKVIEPTEEDLKLHKEFLKREIKKNYFN